MTKQENDEEFRALLQGGIVSINDIRRFESRVCEIRALTRALWFAAAWATIGWALAAWGWLK